MNAVVIFHSVCGNCYLIGKKFQEAFVELGVNVGLYRVNDEDLFSWSSKFAPAKKYYEQILSIPIASPNIMLQNDIIIIGSPTYFYNVSAEIKSFLDLSAKFYITGELAGKIFASYTAVSTIVGGGIKCLEALSCFAKQMGMLLPSMPLKYQNETNLTPDGFIHHSGIASDREICLQHEQLIKSYVKILINQKI